MYRDYQLITAQLVTPPFTDCGELHAATQYIYGVTAVNSESRTEGEMATGAFSTASLSPPASPAVVQIESASNWFIARIRPACDTGGAVLPSYYYALYADKGSDVPIRAAQFLCCSFIVETLEVASNYSVSVYASNSFGQSPIATRELRTSTGVPATPLIMLKRANTYSLSLKIDPPSPADYEIRSYGVTVYQSGGVIQSETLACDFDADSRRQVCQGDFVIRSLSPLTRYSVEVQAHGPNGDSEPSHSTFQTTNESTGTFTLLPMSSTSASMDGIVTVVVRREGGTAGSVNVSVDILEPAGTVLRCETSTNGDPLCDVHLASSGVLSVPAVLGFVDGEESKSVLVSVKDEDYSVLQSASVVLGLVGEPTLLGTQRSVLVRIDQNRQQGFAAFSSSSMETWENASFVKVNLVRLNGSAGSLSVKVDTFDVTEGGSSAFYLPVNRSVVFADRQTLSNLWIRLLNDIYYEGLRAFGVRLTSYSAFELVNASSRAIVTKKVLVLDDEDVSRVLPKAPQNVHVWRKTGGEIEIRWQTPNSTNGALVGGYVVRVSKSLEGNGHFELFNVTQLTFVLSSLPPLFVCQFEVAAWNTFGTGSFTVVMQAQTTDPTPPGPPTSLSVVSRSSSKVLLSWNEPQDAGGSPVTGYYVKVETPAAGRFNAGYVAANVASTSTFTLERLNATTSYGVLVAAVSLAFPVFNETLEGFAVVNVTTETGSVPSAPPEVTLVSAPAAGSLSFQLHPPSDLGGLPILDYALYVRKSNSGSPFSVGCTSASPLVRSTTYTCSVYALLSGSTYEVYATFSNTVVRTSESCCYG